jgi:uncharacterized glyoxalase superfamily protein PhnB
MPKNPPEGYGTVTPWIVARGAAALIDYLTRAFGAEEIARVPNPDGTIGHAEVRIGDSIVMLFDAGSGWPPTPGFFRLYVTDADATLRLAVEAGGTKVTAVRELAFGDRVGRVRDPFGNIWWIQSRVKDLTSEEMNERFTDPGLREAMQYVQQTLAEEMTRRGSREGA